MTYHNSVLLNESIDGLNINPNGTYVDVTFGGGGHSKLILDRLDKGKLFAFDKDESVKKFQIKDKRFKLIHSNFRYISNFLKLEGVNKIDGVLADLGVSSYQFDQADRGFSIRFNGELDMRMNKKDSLSAEQVVNEYTEDQLSDILYKYGELRNSRRIARHIVDSRRINQIITTKDLISAVSHFFPDKKKNKFLARVFQSIRIEVNDEITALKKMLESCSELLQVRGRIVIISYHSLEDRIIKNLFKKGNIEGELSIDIFGNRKMKFKQINKKVIVAGKEEVEVNSRARSAKLRIAEKI